MKRKRHIGIGLVLAFLFFTAPTWGDTVVLHSGARVRGEISTRGATLRVTNADGILELPLSRIRTIRRSAGLRALPSGSTPATAAERGVPPMDRANRFVDRRVSLDFTDAPLVNVLGYLQEVTPASFSYRPSDLNEHRPVTLQLSDVRLGQALDLLLEGRNLEWRTDGRLVRVRPAGEWRRSEMRAYAIGDLMMKVEDRAGPGLRGTGGDSDGGGNEETGLAANDWGGGDWDYDEEEDGDSGGPGGSQSLRGRARDMAHLITSTVHPDSWEDPAVRVFWGGGGEEEEEEPIW